MQWKDLKKKRRVDWYMDRMVFDKALEMAHRRGYSSLQKLLEKMLVDELKTDIIAQEVLNSNK